MAPLSRSVMLRLVFRLGLLLLGGLLWVGCEGRGTPPDVPAGRFTAHVAGAVSDTLRGTAHVRRAGKTLTGLELGARDGPGLSIELEPQPPALRTYEVVEPTLFRLERPDSRPGALAFLTLRHARFESTDGTIELTYVGDDQIGGTFSFRMKGTFIDGGGDDVSVEVTGVVNAPSGR
ncbi:MAG: hypothetical protein ABEL97_01750 [Salinibacter sp.]